MTTINISFQISNPILKTMKELHKINELLEDPRQIQDKTFIQLLKKRIKEEADRVYVQGLLEEQEHLIIYVHSEITRYYAVIKYSVNIQLNCLVEIEA